ncbi:hypothetical protein LSH36_37g08032 [Paralvinella palmiformis]|uniref:Uncharacterized protein n=1 Tax=Paralvinella palmiformis TaxID=53620 RepID=A0AAD9K8E5_9ANNE|nr:hypothetical protein LSH36_37g08032 [Paralvinella palmiformis]
MVKNINNNSQVIFHLEGWLIFCQKSRWLYLIPEFLQMFSEHVCLRVITCYMTSYILIDGWMSREVRVVRIRLNSDAVLQNKTFVANNLLTMHADTLETPNVLAKERLKVSIKRQTNYT